LQTQHGQMQIEPAKQAILSQLVTNAKIPHSIAELNEHTYAAITIGELADTLALAETICSQVTEHAAFTLGATDRITLSIGLAFAPNQTASESTHSATALLDQAEHALRQAIQSGGNSIVQFGQFAEEEAGWAELATTGKLFEYTLARDIMVPSSLSLNHRDTIAQAAELFQQTQLRALPVVDEEGKLAGLLSASAVQSQLAKPNGGNLPANSVMTVDVVSFDEQTTLTALIDYFTQESPLVIVIVNKGRPTGLVTPSSLATLCEQLTTETFAGTPEHSSLLAGLVVPNLCGVDAE
ncbi:MAG: CBS domain-containing protein, partial [Planctomycetota bacterium]|nr:CBS domain-containing protein [Planctomycetota bacterium]